MLPIGGRLWRPGEVLGGEANRHSAFPDSGRDHLCRSGTDVADSEDSRPARFDEKRSAAKRPPRISVSQRSREGWARQHVAVVVERDLAREPIRSRLRADQDDHDTGSPR